MVAHSQVESETTHNEHTRELHAIEQRLQRQLIDTEKRLKQQIQTLEKERNSQ